MLKVKTMSKALTIVIVAAGLATVGCDIDVNETAKPPVTGDGVNIDADADADTPGESRMERREERREDLRDAVDGVDVNVGDDGVSVDVDGK